MNLFQSLDIIIIIIAGAAHVLSNKTIHNTINVVST